MRIRKESIVNGLRQVIEVEDASAGMCLSTLREVESSPQPGPVKTRDQTHIMLVPGLKVDLVCPSRRSAVGQITVGEDGQPSVEFFSSPGYVYGISYDTVTELDPHDQVKVALLSREA